jgi:hypothetical protein
MEIRSFVLFYFPLVIGSLATISAAYYVFRLRRHLRREKDLNTQPKVQQGG